MNKKNRFDINHYFLRWQDGRLSASEQEQLEAWLAASDENQKAWNQLENIWQRSSAVPVPTGKTPQEQWRELWQRVSVEGQQSHKSRPSWDSILSQFLSIWAEYKFKWMVAIAGAAILFATLKFGPSLFEPALQTVNVPYGQHFELTLQDGSEVQLNAGSVFQYPKSFDSNIRKVELRGEAFFQVEPAEKPFMVETDQAQTRVLGTQFNVCSWEDETIIFVKTGKVSIRSRFNNEEEMTLLEGQSAICKKHAVSLNPATAPEDVLAWRERRLVFRNAPLDEVLSEIERFFNVRIEAHSSLLHHTITARFEKEPLPKVIDIVATTLNATYEKQDSGYRLTAK